MYVVVYQMRQGGEKLDKATVRERPVAGWLVLGQDTRKLFPCVAARLFKGEKAPIDVIEPMIYARVTGIAKGGIIIHGSEEVRSSTTHRQSWFCVPGSLDDLGTGAVAGGAYDPQP